MPHLTLEASYNVAPKEQLTELLATLHQLVGSYENVDMETLKSRLVDRSVFFVGASGYENRFMFCTLDILPGPKRTPAWKKAIARALFDRLQEGSAAWVPTGSKLSINVEIRELNADFFLKN